MKGAGNESPMDFAMRSGMRDVVRSPTVPRLPGVQSPRRTGPHSLAPNVLYEFGPVSYGPEPGQRLRLARWPGLGRVVYQNGTSMKPFVVLASSWFDTWRPLVPRHP